MNKIRFLLLGILLVSIFAACAPAVTPAEAEEVDLSTLPQDLDVDSVAAIAERDDVVLLDVREQHEYDAGHIPGVVLLPTSTYPSWLDEIPTDKTVIVTCRTGNRSGQITALLKAEGFDNVHNMLGGIVEWDRRGYEIEIP